MEKVNRVAATLMHTECSGSREGARELARHHSATLAPVMAMCALCAGIHGHAGDSGQRAALGRKDTGCAPQRPPAAPTNRVPGRRCPGRPQPGWLSPRKRRDSSLRTRQSYILPQRRQLTTGFCSALGPAPPAVLPPASAAAAAAAPRPLRRAGCTVVRTLGPMYKSGCSVADAWGVQGGRGGERGAGRRGAGLGT